jgi:Arc/MetJ family transcription regulator
VAKTLIDVDVQLLARAQRILGTTTKKATVNGALAEVVRLACAQEFLALAGSDAFCFREGAAG